MSTSPIAVKKPTALMTPHVPARRPWCGPGKHRLARIQSLASTAQAIDKQRAATAYNLAALLARDCGAIALARNLCFEQFDAYTARHGMSGSALALALQPLVNIARLHLFDGDGTRAFEAIEALVTAARTGGCASVFDRTIEFPDPAAEGPARRLVELVMATDGMRALLIDGRWDAVLEHCEHMNGFGKQLNGPAQATVIALAMLGDSEMAERLLRSCETPTPWDKAVAGLLTVLLFGPVDKLAAEYLGIPAPAENIVAGCRLGLAVAAVVHPTDRERVFAELVDRTLACGDAYAAREMLESPWYGLMSRPALESMREVVRAARLDSPSFAAELAEVLPAVLTPCRRVLGSI